MKYDPLPPLQDDARHDPNAVPPARRISRRGLWLGAAIALLVLAGLGWWAWTLTRAPAATGAPQARASGPAGPGAGGPGGAGGLRGGPPTTVGVAVAVHSELPVTVEALGTVTPQATVRVRPQVTGVLQQVHYQEGGMVKKGDLLATIDPRQFEMALQQATGQRMRDEAQLDAARVTLQRYQTLLQQDSIARQDVDTQAALVKQLEAAVVVDKANEGAARLNLGYTRITSPITGRVGLRPVDIGNVVSPSDTNGVAVVTQLSPIDVEFSIPQDQAAGLAQQTGGAPMTVKALDRTRTAVLDTGSFSSLDNLVDAQTGTVRAKARFANAKGQLFPSQFVNVQLQLRTIPNAVTVPVAAVRTGANGDYVFVLQPDATVQLRNVQRGQSLPDRVQILAGLQPGERVVTEGGDRLRDGSRVVLPDQAGGRRGAASAAAAAGQGAASAARAAASGPAQGSAAAPAAAPAPAGGVAAAPTPEQRQRLLDAAQGDPAQLERRKRFLEALDRGDPQAQERWQQMQQRRAQGGSSQ